MLIGQDNNLEYKIKNFIRFKILPTPDDIGIRRYYHSSDDKVHITFFYIGDNRPNDGWFIGQDIMIKHADIIMFDRMNKIKEIIC